MNRAVSRIALVSMLAVVVLCPALVSAAPPLHLSTEKGEVEIAFERLTTAVKVHSLEVHDPVYGKLKRYSAVALVDILDMVDTNMRGQGSSLIFMTRDGYKAIASLDDVARYEAYVAFKDESSSSQFEPLHKGDCAVDLSPYYLVHSQGHAPISG